MDEKGEKSNLVQNNFVCVKPQVGAVGQAGLFRLGQSGDIHLKKEKRGEEGGRREEGKGQLDLQFLPWTICLRNSFFVERIVEGTWGIKTNLRDTHGQALGKKRLEKEETKQTKKKNDPLLKRKKENKKKERGT